MIEQEFKTPGDALAHHGVKGMKWGIRKVENFNPTFARKEITQTTKNGDVFKLSPNPETRFGAFLNQYSARSRKNTESTSFLTIKDKKGANIGSLQLWKKSKDEVNVIWIDTEPSVRGRGYATAVMKSVQEIAKNEGAKKVTLEVPGISPDAKHVYEKLGFVDSPNPQHKPNKRDVWGGLTEMEYHIK